MKDDWILKNACYEDGTTSKDERNKDNARNLKIVHRKCYELKQQQQRNDLEDDDRLKPKLYDKNQTISKIEEQFNENGASLALSQIAMKQSKAKKRKIDQLFGASEDDDDDDDDDEDEGQGVNGTVEKLLKISKKRKLNDGKIEALMKEKKMRSDKEEMDAEHEEVGVVDDDKDTF